MQPNDPAEQELAIPEREELVLPHSRELIDLTDEVKCGMALDELRGMQAQMNHAARVLSEAIAAQAAIYGRKTVKLPGGRTAAVQGGSERVYDPAEIEQGLRALGMPEDRIREIVREEIRYTVRAVEVKRAAAANPAYAEVIEAATTEIEKPITVVIRQTRQPSR